MMTVQAVIMKSSVLCLKSSTSLMDSRAEATWRYSWLRIVLILSILHCFVLVDSIVKSNSAYLILKVERTFSRSTPATWVWRRTLDSNCSLDYVHRLPVLISDQCAPKLVCLRFAQEEKQSAKKISWMQSRKSSRDMPNSPLLRSTWCTTEGEVRVLR